MTWSNMESYNQTKQVQVQHHGKTKQSTQSTQEAPQQAVQPTLQQALQLLLL